MNTYEVLELLEQTSGTNDKIKILKENDSPQLREFLNIALNPYKVYGIAKLDGTGVSPPIHKSLKEVTDYLQTQNGSKEARSNVESYLVVQSELKRKWDQKAILKKSIASSGVRLVNKAFPKLIPTFDVMLADGKSVKAEDVKFPILQQRKLDGFRNLRMPDGSALGRNGKLHANVNLKNHIKGATEYILDGELYSHEVPFQTISSILRKENGKIPSHIKYIVYDALMVSEFQNKKCNVPYEERLKRVEDAVSKLSNAKSIESFVVENTEQLKELDKQFVENGYEGSMIKDLSGLYTFKRCTLSSGIMMKYKSFQELDGKIIGTFQGEGNFTGKLGGVIVRIENIQNSVRVGSGFSEAQRDDYWKERESLIGQWIRVKAQEITENNMSVRFPVFKGIRDPKD